ncbi:[acyl-carrier-protein] S-malonyltransferase [Anaerosporobacter mobilis DSM 15930]|jgi:[acyl-carrier-protein] S-malonyltransferase|uniref:Malonyl CoA-acyl carrier protein transacylase n=1 Tax=Anaerosporobacter mobilis DSM 15930 TaxID=1120996 RepID=A0A1M7G9U2_9FIRM|nr:ACP S-malonyltransferase [Anaerosporobacter mobilis]SHM12946.1 [acyl-carrier-protein] S-malonyltransferase [Anaerosporobacter mobilis DSM 15930]
MYKTAFLFPGQGAQYVGMAKDFYEQVEESKEVFERANKVLDFDVIKMCFEENEELNQTEYTQAAMVTACVSILEAVKKKGIKADITAGLSLGEYAALVANDVLSFEDAVALVRKRGIYMSNEVPNGEGSMAAILGLDVETIERICKEVEDETNMCVQPANYNCPGQIVISGKKEAVLAACDRLKEAGAKRALELKVSGPFHSALLKGAGDKLSEELKNVVVNPMTIPYVCNAKAEIVLDVSQTKELLEKQVYSPVRWQQTMELMIANGVTTFVEIGPGKTLSGFLKKIDKTVTVINIEKMEDLEKLEGIVC